jgi:putative PEP-CTERM system TPR-repeat lipoprotein
MTTTPSPFRAIALAIALSLAACSSNDPATMIESAKGYLAKSDPNAAVIQLKNALQKAPDNGEARYLLARALLQTGDSVGAETEVRKAIELKYSFDQSYPLLARALVRQGESRKALELADRPVLDPKARADLLTSMAAAHLGMRDVEAARKAIDEALRLAPDDAHALLVASHVAASDGDAAEAMRKVDAALAKSPGDVEATIFKAQLMTSQGDRDGAIKVLEALVAANPEATAPRFALASQLVTANRLDDTAAQLAKLREKAPNDLRTLYTDALWSYAKGDDARTRELTQRVLTVAPDHLPSLMLSGLAQLRLKSYQGAEETLSRVVARVPEDANARRALAVVYLNTGRANQALETLAPMLRSGAPDPMVLRTAGEAAMASGNAAQAAQLFERAAAVDKNVGAQVRLAQVRMATGDTERAFRDLEALSASDATQYESDLALIAGHLRRREYDKALAAADRLQKKQPDSAFAYTVRGSVYLAKRDLVNARASFDKALTLDPKHFTAAYNLAMLDLREGKASAAKDRYEALLAKNPNDEQLLLAEAELLAITGSAPEASRALIDRSITAHPTSVRSRLALVALANRQRDFKAALSAAQAGLAAIPGDPQLEEALGVSQIASKEYNQALETFRRAAQAQPQNAGLQMRLAEAQIASKDLEGAIVSTRKALALQPGNAQAWLNLAKLLLASGRPEQALSEARKLQKDRPDKALGYALEGEVFALQQKWDDAAAAYRTAHAKEPMPMTATRLWLMLQNAGKATDATAMADKWNREHPKDVTLRSLAAQQSQARGDARAALAQYKAALEIEPDNVLLLNNIAWLLTEAKDPAGQEYAERAYRVSPFNANVMDTLGWALVSGSDVARGTRLLQMAANLSPGDNDIRYHLGVALAKSGNKAAARAQLEPLTRLDATSPVRSQAEKTLSTL